MSALVHRLVGPFARTPDAPILVEPARVTTVHRGARESVEGDGAVLVGLLAGVPWIAATLNATEHIASWNHRTYVAVACLITLALIVYGNLTRWVTMTREHREEWE